MSNRVLRSVVLACSLLLVLPQCWCCILASPMKAAATKATVPVHQTGCCKCCKQESQPQPHPTPRLPAPPAKPCCYVNLAGLASLPSPLEQPDAGFALVALLPLLDSPAPLIHGVIGEVVFPPPTLHVHLLKCVWLC